MSQKYVVKRKCTGEYLASYGRNKIGPFTTWTKDRDDAIEFYDKENAEESLQKIGSACWCEPEENCPGAEEAALSDGFKIVIESVEPKSLNTRGTLYIEGETSPRKFCYHHTHRHMKPTGCAEAQGAPVPGGALRTVPPKLQEAVGRKKFVRIFNQISDAMWHVWACNGDVSKESIFSPQAKQQINAMKAKSAASHAAVKAAWSETSEDEIPF